MHACENILRHIRHQHRCGLLGVALALDSGPKQLLPGLLILIEPIEELLLADDAILVDVELYEELVDLWGRGEGLSGQK